MKYAIVNNEKSEAAPRLKGFCQFCGSPVISKCGSLKIWHWAHCNDSNCDPWHENETEWHQKWKNCFPVQNQEIIHYDEMNNEKHIADVKTNNGMIIEFQNSPIKYSELQAREKFYKNMFWIVNASVFKNFKILERVPNPESLEMQNISLWMPINEKCYTGYHLVSELDENDGMIECYCAEKFRIKAIEENSEFYFYYWERPREVWYDAIKPVFFDFNDEYLYLLKKYPRQRFKCLRGILKKELIEKNGGYFYN